MSFEYISKYALLTNDALNAAAMKNNDIPGIVTNDNDFMRVTDIQVWRLQ